MNEDLSSKDRLLTSAIKVTDGSNLLIGGYYIEAVLYGAIIYSKRKNKVYAE